MLFYDISVKLEGDNGLLMFFYLYFVPEQESP